MLFNAFHPGLCKDDLMNEEDIPELVEAVRRLPEEEQNLRIFRIKRALDLSMKHQLLPKEEWTKPEEVVLSQTFKAAFSKPV